VRIGVRSTLLAARILFEQVTSRFGRRVRQPHVTLEFEKRIRLVVGVLLAVEFEHREHQPLHLLRYFFDLLGDVAVLRALRCIALVLWFDGVRAECVPAFPREGMNPLRVVLDVLFQVVVEAIAPRPAEGGT